MLDERYSEPFESAGAFTREIWTVERWSVTLWATLRSGPCGCTRPLATMRRTAATPSSTSFTGTWDVSTVIGTGLDGFPPSPASLTTCSATRRCHRQLSS